VTLERGKALAEELLKGWEAGELPVVKVDLAPAKHRIILVDRPEGQQSNIEMGVRAYDIRSEEKYAGSVANQVLTGGIDSRLMKYVRAEKGLAYGVHAVFSPGRQAGSFTGATETKVPTTGEAIEAMFHVFEGMREQPVRPEELEYARTRVAGSMVMRMDTIGEQASYRLEGILNSYPIDYYDRYPERIAAVTAQQVEDVMKRYVDEGRMVIVVVGPAEAVKPQLEKLGEVEVVAMPGRRNAKSEAGVQRPE